MECRQARRKISAHRDQELDPATIRQLELHLHQCAGCRGLLDDFHKIDALVRGLPKIDPGPDFAAQLLRRVHGAGVSGELEHGAGSSLFQRLSRIAEDFMDVLSSTRSPSTGTLDEFSDFPPLSMGYIYFHLMDLHAR